MLLWLKLDQWHLFRCDILQVYLQEVLRFKLRAYSGDADTLEKATITSWRCDLHMLELTRDL